MCGLSTIGCNNTAPGRRCVYVLVERSVLVSDSHTITVNGVYSNMSQILVDELTASQVPVAMEIDSDDKVDGTTSRKSKDEEADAISTDHLEVTDNQSNSGNPCHIRAKKDPVEKLEVPGDDGYVEFSEGPEERARNVVDQDNTSVTQDPVEKLEVPGDDGYVEFSEVPEERARNVVDQDNTSVTQEFDTNHAADDGYVLPDSAESEVDQTGYLIPSPDPVEKLDDIGVDGYVCPSDSEDVKNEKQYYDYVTQMETDQKKTDYDYPTNLQILGMTRNEHHYDDQRPRPSGRSRQVDAWEKFKETEESMDVYLEINDDENPAQGIYEEIRHIAPRDTKQRLKIWLRDNRIRVGVIMALIVILCLIGVIVALVVPPPPPPPTEVITTPTALLGVETTAAPTHPPGYKYCQHNSPCQNGGTCVDLPDFKYMCVCPKCNCSSAKPFGDCVIDEATICLKDLPPLNYVPHPYLCHKFYDCDPSTTSQRETYVWHSGDHVFNPANDKSEYPEDVPCAVTMYPELCADVACANGGTCRDTQSGFTCDCLADYGGKKCDFTLN